MSRIFFDCEFIEDGRTIDLISIGMVGDDGEELYLINRKAPLHRIARHDWLPDNVVPHLPLRSTQEEVVTMAGRREWRPKLMWDISHPDYALVVSPDRIRERVHEFVMLRHDPQLWAWYAAYDHVVLCQLFGRMVDLPPGFPQYSNDLRQEVARTGLTGWPVQKSGQHNALADAKWNRSMHSWLQHASGVALPYIPRQGRPTPGVGDVESD